MPLQEEGQKPTGSNINQSGIKPSFLQKMSKESVMKIVHSLEDLKRQGMDQRDPRFVALLRVLQIQRNHGHNINWDPRNSNGNTSTTFSNGPPSNPPVNNSNLEQSKSELLNGNGTTKAKGTNPSKLGIAPHQLVQLKAQIVAYKFLTKNLPLPPQVLNAIRSPFKPQPSMNSSAPTSIPVQNTFVQPKPSATTPVPSQTPSSQPPTQRTTAIVPPSQLPSPQPSPSSQPPTQVSSVQPSQPQAQIPSALIPDKLGLAYLVSEREKRISARMTSRLEQLNALSSEIPEDMKRKAMIEVKQLRLLQTQKKLRANIIERMRRMAELESTIDPSIFKRAKKPKDLSKLDRNASRLGLNKELKMEKHRDFLVAVLKHVGEFKKFHEQNLKKKKKISREIVTYLSNEQRKQQAREQRNQRERLEALKRNDEEGYLKLLEETKNGRLALLLKQTDDYLQKISEMIQGQKDHDEIEEKKRELKEKQKGKGVGRGKKKDSSKDKDERDSEDEEKQAATNTIIANNKRYYTTAHTIEETTEQPQMLVGGKLKSYQLVGLQWLVSLYNNKLNGILADEMGLGKTIQTISLITYLMERKNNNGPFLVVVPLSTLSNWAMEFTRWAPSVAVVIYKGKPPTRKAIYKEEVVGGMYNVLLTSYEYVMIDKSDLGRIEWNYIIIDEGHRIKNKKSKLSTILRQYMSRHRLLLTGTPLQNDLGELWSLLNFLLPQIFNSADNFQQWFNSPFEYARKGKNSPDFIAPNEEEKLLIINRLHKVLRPFLLRRLKKEVEHDLPGKVENVLKCELSALQKKMYKNMIERGVMLLDPENQKGKKNAKGFNNTIMQLQKICNHPYLFREEWDIDEDLIRTSGKFELLDRLLLKMKIANHRVLIFNQMTHVMDILEDYFSIRGHANSYLRLDGSTKAEDRAALVKTWNEENSPYWIFILSTKAGGLGLNLQTADTVILFDTDWNPHMDLQAQDRVHRIGQQKEVRVFRLVTHNSVEEKILERASFKLEVDAKVIQAGMFNTTSSEKDRKKMLESLLLEESDKEEAECIESDEQLNELIARDEEELELFNKLDKEKKEKEEAEWRASGGKRKKPSRLMQEDELPDYLVQETQDEDVTIVYGRGRRERQEIQYDDSLSDIQFTKMLEGNEPKKRPRSETFDDDEPKKKPKKDKEKKKKYKKKEEKIYSPEPPIAKNNSDLIKKMEEIWNNVAELKEGDRSLSLLFLKRPSKRDYSDYYHIIKQPISLNNIKAYIHSKYRNVEEFRSDFDLLVRNAQIYNDPNSQIYQDSITLKKFFDEEIQRVFGIKLKDKMEIDFLKSEENTTQSPSIY